MGRRRPIIAHPSLRKGRGDWVSPNFMLSVFPSHSPLSVTSFYESPCYRLWSYLSQLDVPLSQSGRGKERKMKMFLDWVVVKRRAFTFIKFINVQHLPSLKLDCSITSTALPSEYLAFDIYTSFIFSLLTSFEWHVPWPLTDTIITKLRNLLLKYENVMEIGCLTGHTTQEWRARSERRRTVRALSRSLPHLGLTLASPVTWKGQAWNATSLIIQRTMGSDPICTQGSHTLSSSFSLFFFITPCYSSLSSLHTSLKGGKYSRLCAMWNNKVIVVVCCFECQLGLSFVYSGLSGKKTMTAYRLFCDVLFA